MSEPTLSEALRAAADLCEVIGWERNITWSGTRKVHFHAADDTQHAHLIDSLTVHAIQTGDGTQRGVDVDGTDYELDLSEWHLASGLAVTVFGPRRALTEAAA